MKFKYSLCTIVAGASMLFTACSPDDYSLGTPAYEAADLVQGITYTVTPDAADPNTIHLHSLLKGATPLWETPQGRSQKEDMTIQLPFAGEYSVTFGAMTQAGPVYGEPYTFTITNNNFAMLEDEIWSNLAGGVGKSRKWRPMNGDYGIGRCSGPVMYMNPDDVLNDGTGVTDVMFGSANWKPNWDPGFQSWLIPADDPYMDSYMEFGLDATNGCTAVVYRNADSGATTMNGKFSLNVSDAKHPTITFDKCYALHNYGFDDVCANYTVDIKILECTPYLLQLATMRTNSEGAWWIVWNFISDEAYQDPSIIPTEDAGLLTTTAVKEPEYDNLAETLFTIVGDEASYVASSTTLLLDDEKPYQWLWWNPASGAWEDNGAAKWAPTYADAADFSLKLSTTKEAGVYKAELENAEGSATSTFTISGNKLKFAQPIQLFSVSNSQTTVALEGDEFTVLACNPDDSKVVLGIPAGTDETGAVNKYLCANLTIKAISSGATGPTTVAVDNEKLNVYIQENKYFRIELYNPWNSSWDWPIDITKVKLKNGQTLSLTFKVSGLTWDEGAAPKAALCHNMEGSSWEPDCFGLSNAVALNKSGETTVTATNTLGTTYKFDNADSPSCVTVCIQLDGYGTCPLKEDGSVDTDQVKVEVTSLTIQ